MSTNEKQNSEYLETLKSNYRRRIEEIDSFSRNFSKTSADFRSQYLASLSDMLQHYLDLQKKFTKNYPLWYDAGVMGRQSKMITEYLTDIMRNSSSFHSLLLDYSTKNLRIFDQAMIQIMRMVEMYYDMPEKMPIQKNMLVEIIKQVKENSDSFMQKQIPKKNAMSSKKTQKRQVVVEKAS